jgi:hypothetical protein
MVRLAARSAGASASDATGAIYQRQRAAVASAPPIPADAAHIRIDTTADFARQLEPLFAMLRAEGIIQARVPAAPALMAIEGRSSCETPFAGGGPRASARRWGGIGRSCRS